MIKTIKMTQKGQITIPHNIRKQMTSNIIQIHLTKQGIILNPIDNVGGSLKKLAKNIPFDQARKKAWETVASDKQ